MLHIINGETISMLGKQEAKFRKGLHLLLHEFYLQYL